MGTHLYCGKATSNAYVSRMSAESALNKKKLRASIPTSLHRQEDDFARKISPMPWCALSCQTLPWWVHRFPRAVRNRTRPNLEIFGLSLLTATSFTDQREIWHATVNLECLLSSTSNLNWISASCDACGARNHQSDRFQNIWGLPSHTPATNPPIGVKFATPQWTSACSFMPTFMVIGASRDPCGAR